MKSCCWYLNNSKSKNEQKREVHISRMGSYWIKWTDNKVSHLIFFKDEWRTDPFCKWINLNKPSNLLQRWMKNWFLLQMNKLEQFTLQHTIMIIGITSKITDPLKTLVKPVTKSHKNFQITWSIRRSMKHNANITAEKQMTTENPYIWWSNLKISNREEILN